MPEKPRDRAVPANDPAAPETKTENLKRYELGGFEENAQHTIGVDVKYSDAEPQGVAITSFDVDSTAKAAGINLHEKILEVNGAAVGSIRGRHYEPWKFYQRFGKSSPPELLVSFQTQGSRKCYYPSVELSGISYSLVNDPPPIYPPDFFTVSPPQDRAEAETELVNLARYKYGVGNFETYAKWRLGVNVKYSYTYGALVTFVDSAGPAGKAGLQVGDMILEVDGAPVGVFQNRTYEIWRQTFFSKSGEVEFLVAFQKPGTNTLLYYYPIIKLEKLDSPN